MSKPALDFGAIKEEKQGRRFCRRYLAAAFPESRFHIAFEKQPLPVPLTNYTPFDMYPIERFAVTDISANGICVEFRRDKGVEDIVKLGGHAVVDVWLRGALAESWQILATVSRFQAIRDARSRIRAGCHFELWRPLGFQHGWFKSDPCEGIGALSASLGRCDLKRGGALSLMAPHSAARRRAFLRFGAPVFRHLS